MRTPKNTAAGALVGIWAILLVSFVIAVLSVGKEILIPIALAALITFLLAPLVGWLERWIGRIAAVLLVVLMLFSVAAGAGWMLTRQVIDLAAKLPDYQANIATKMHALRMPAGGTYARFTKSIEQLQKELSAPSSTPAENAASRSSPNDLTPSAAKPAQSPVAVRVIDSESHLTRVAETALSGLLTPLGTAGLVLLLVIFMLLKREDLRGRLIRLIGQGRISVTTRAMDDAGSRVARYLTMQLLVNVVYGTCVAVGLYFIGVPNAALWGVLSAILRFIPYIGPWIGAALPLFLSLAVSTSWLGPLLTLGMFLALELINANAVEPWLYGSSTGVSSIALIVAAVFWTWLWGPLGLVLSTPLTVCLAVMGRHVPKLEFLSVLLSEERALTPDEECYHRLLAGGFDDASDLAENYLRENSLTALYDAVLIPVVTAAETDAQRDALQPEERTAVLQNVQDVIEDFGTLPLPESKVEADIAVAEQTPEAAIAPTCRVLCLPARALRDEIAGAMLTQLLRQQGFEAENAPAELASSALVDLAEKTTPEAVCVSVVAPSTSIQARHLTAKLRARLPDLKIVVGFWGATEKLADAAQRLRASGADEVVTSLAEAVVQLAKFAVPLDDEMENAPIGENEDARLAELQSLNLLEAGPDKAFDRVTAKLAKIFQVPIALITFIDRDRQWFKSQVGLPEDLAREGSTPRTVSVCGHVVAKNEVLVVEDLARDRRFANNPFLKSRGLRFYAGVPIRGPSGRAIGSLCLLDTKPRKLTEHDRRLLEVFADDLSEEIKSRVPEKESAPVVNTASELEPTAAGG